MFWTIVKIAKENDFDSLYSVKGKYADGARAQALFAFTWTAQGTR